jgi:uncharacterized protein YecE (DUF72 family)
LAELRIGTSGWSYNEWNGVFYPSPSTNKLSFYSKVYSTVEVDSTFYAFPSKGLVLGWERNTPDDFVFSVKLPRQITHEKRLEAEKGVEADLVRFLGLLKPLMVAGKLGPVLIQLPPSCTFQADFERLERFIDMTPGDVSFAVEFRHPSWLRGEVWDFIRGRNVANVIVDEPLLPPDTVVTADFAFIRWHGRGSRPWYNYRYGDRELEGWAPKVKEVAARVKKTFGYFNNHFRGFAVENSLRMMEILGASGPSQQGARARATRFIESGGKDTGEGSILEFVGEGARK